MNAFYRHLRSAAQRLPLSACKCVVRRRARVGRSVHLSAKFSKEDNGLDHGSALDFDEYDALLAKHPHRTVLVPDVTDPHLQQLLSSQTPSELFSCISKLGTPCPLVYAAQAVVSLWDLKKLSDNLNKSFDATAACSSPDFNILMNQLQHDCSSLSDTCLTAVLVSLKRLLHEPVIPAYHALLSEAYLRCSSFNLQDLSRFIVSLNQSKNVALAYQCLALERLQHLLPRCTTEQELKCAAISLRRLVHLSSPSLITAFCSKVSEILTPASHVHTLLRCLPVTCLEPQHNHYDSCMVKILTYLNASMESLDPIDLASLADAVGEAQCNASDTLKLLQERARQLYKQEPSISVAHSLVMGPPLQQRERLELESSLHKLLDSDLSLRSILHFADITVWLPITNNDILTLFWNLAADLSNPSLVHLIRRYLSCYQHVHFRSKPFETVLLEWSKEKLEHAWKMGPVALAAQCLLTLEPSAVSPENVERLSSLLGQLSSWSLLELSLGLKAAERMPSGMFRRHALPPLLMDLKTNVHGEIRKRVETTQTLAELTIMTVSNRVLWSSRGHHEQLKESIAARCAVLPDSGSPRSLASFCKALTLERLWVPDYLNRTVAHAADKPEWLFPVTMCQLPYVCFVSGHVPDRVEPLATVVNSSLLRHFNDLPTTELLQAAVALGFFQCLESDLIHRIFSLSFMERLDQELTGFVTSDHRDHHVRVLLATLNRIACLDFPEERVPWFHEQYFAARAVNGRRRFFSPLQRDVRDNLAHVLGGSEFVQGHVLAPYSYYLPMFCVLDASKQPVAVNSSSGNLHNTSQSEVPTVFSTGHKRIAVLVLGEGSYCENYPQLTGYQQLKIRHLEILGYQLVLVPFYEWNSMKLAEPGAKQDYLRAKVFGVS